MRQNYSTITPSLVRSTALQQALPWKRYGRRVNVLRLLDVLLLVATVRSSLAVVVRRFRFGFSHENARQAVNANLSDRQSLQQGLVEWVTEKSRQHVRTQAVVQRPREAMVKVYAFGGWGASSALWRARQAKRSYRRRLGIETSYGPPKSTLAKEPRKKQEKP